MGSLFIMPFTPLLVLWTVLLSAPALASIPQLIAEVHQKQLAKDIQWLNLGHYKKDLLGGYASQVDGAAFFLSPDGKSDPQRELEATIHAFFTADVQGDKEHPQCRFPARFRWLNKKLNFNAHALPRPDCDKLDKYRKRLSAESASLVFSSYYLNNPSSAFGHSFLRINKSGGPAAGDSTRSRYELLDHGINFAAEVTTSNPMLYAFYGLFGMFKGTFTEVPYYYKVREYNDYEARDLWSYDLDLTREELEMLVDHAWELGHSYYDYYYLTENCSYHILTTVEAAAPRFKVTERIPHYVIPSDTIKAAMQEPGFVKDISFRPASRTQFHHRVDALSDAEQAKLGALLASSDYRQAAQDLSSDLVPEAKVRLLDAALDYMEYRYPEDLIKEGTESAKRRQQLLLARAKIPIQSQELRITPSVNERPHQGHNSRRLGINFGHEDGRGEFASLSMRFALHDLLDPGAGYPANAQIEFMNAVGRYNLDERSFELDQLTLFRVLSLTPLSRFEKRVSWRVEVGARRVLDENCDRCVAGGGELGFGGAIEPSDALTLFAFAEGEAAWSPKFIGSNGRLGLGPRLGVVTRLSNSVKVLVEGNYRYLAFAAVNETYRTSATLRWGIGKNMAWDVQGSLRPDSWDAGSGIYLYF